MSLNITIPQPKVIRPKISVFGVGGAGGNALNNMILSNLEGVEFIAANTDAQSLQNSLASNRIQLGLNTTKGLGAGSFPDRGKIAAEENVNDIIKFLEGNNMIFITAGMGGGTGTGAAPVIAKLAKEKDILTVGVVTKPFDFEGKYRMEAALQGIDDLKKFVDTLIVIPNQNLFRVANEKTTFESAFKMADNVLHAGVRGITDLITMPGLVNLDFADIKTIMTKMGKAMMGTGEAEGENRAVIACQEAISNPLLDDVSIRGAKGVLVNMTGGPDMTLFEADQAVNEIRKQVDDNANIIFGSAFNDNMKGKIRVSVVATGIDYDSDTIFVASDSISRENRSQAEQPAKTGQNQSFFDPFAIKNIDSKVQAIGSGFKPGIDINNFIQSEKIKINDQEEVENNFASPNENFSEAQFQPAFSGQHNTQSAQAQQFHGQNPQYVAPQNSSFSQSTFSNHMPFDANQNLGKEFETVSHNNFEPIEKEEPINQKYIDEDQDEDSDTGFSLFRFITGSKKAKEAREAAKERLERPKATYQPQEQTRAAFKAEKQEILDFSFHDNIIEELPRNNHSKNNPTSEEDLLNIPTFFRKKENNG